MIDMIGKKRLGILLVLVCFILASVVYLFSLYDAYDSEYMAISKKKGELAELEDELALIEGDFNDLKIKALRIESLRRRGFFETQDRVAVKDALNPLQNRSLIDSIRLNIGEQRTLENATYDNLEGDVVLSPVTFSFDALHDRRVYDFIRKVDRYFPGYLVPRRLMITKINDVSDDMLQTATADRFPKFVRADVEYEWFSVLEEPEEAPLDMPEEEIAP